MTENRTPIFIGNTPQKHSDKPILGEFIPLYGDIFYKIHNYDELEPFFMSIVSSSDHWLFISSTGGLSAGRVSAEQALFPYYTVDKITENYDNTGNKAILLVNRSGATSLWEPFSDRYRDNYRIERNIYKNIASTMLIFEESNLDLGMTYRYAWRTSEKFGFVKTTWLTNLHDSDCHVELLDGLQNILPANVTMATQQTFGSLLDAYKRSELDPVTGLAIFALNATLTDLPEPSESLMVTTVAQLGLDHTDYLISSVQVDQFRHGKGVTQEIEMRGQRGAYFVHTSLDFTAKQEYAWHLFADVNQDNTAITLKRNELCDHKIALWDELEKDIATNQLQLRKIVSSADGLQTTRYQNRTTHHFANVMFNVMRGGIFADQYRIDSAEFIEFVSSHNPSIVQENSHILSALPTYVQGSELRVWADSTASKELQRLSRSYLPLTFSRRHGDPSRPWNRFEINLKNDDGSLRINYEGNWRDIFQNWEALAYSFPEFVENMISTFLNATTADGYNPYRITAQGVDWELPQPNNPWANIGYWSDHQIIYLQKLMEISAKVHPGELQSMLNQALFSFSNVPYQIKPYTELLKNPYRTILLNWDLQAQIEMRTSAGGTDAKLIHSRTNQVLQVSLTEKMLTLLLAKLACFVPEGGIWMNTQRPEWNDANNALVGKGLSVVTLCYIYRYITFSKELFHQSLLSDVTISAEVFQFYINVSGILNRYKLLLPETFNDQQRREVMDALGNAGSEYRWNIYQNGFSGEQAVLEVSGIINFLDLVQLYVEQTLRANRRSDHLYHAYNILHLDNQNASVKHLYEMLEGQVAILSSGLLSAEESLALLESIRHSSLYQADRDSYILYPDRDLPSLFERNCITEEKASGILLFTKLIDANDRSLIDKDIHGVYHFNSRFHNVHDLNQALKVLQQDSQFAFLVDVESEKIRILFEETFRHDEFTGRSGTFFAYEGLGSIYWHMVSKLLLAVQETAIRFKEHPLAEQLRNIYFGIRAGLGFNKTPAQFGAFPTDPYSHTPKGQGAKQPGMTGLVKEEILTRMAELGLVVEDGQLLFDPFLLDTTELLVEPSVFSWVDTADRSQSFELSPGSLAYTLCQVPIVLKASQVAMIEIFRADGKKDAVQGRKLDKTYSRHIFLRDGYIHHLCVYFEIRDNKS